MFETRVELQDEPFSPTKKKSSSLITDGTRPLSAAVEVSATGREMKNSFSYHG